MDFLFEYSIQLKQKGLYRQRILLPEQALNFSSNDYLSLTQDVRVKKAYQKGFEQYPTGSGGSMVICGYHPVHQKLEQAFAEALGVDDVLLFSSGFAANLAIVSLLTRFKYQIFIDKAVHASFYEGLRLSQARYTRFLHQNVDHLTKKLQNATLLAKKSVITETVFSMTGQCADLKAIIQAGTPFETLLIVDEAHAFGVVGPQGLGAVVLHDFSQNEIPLRVIPLGKAFGAQGAIVAGKQQWIDALLQAGRSYIYSTGISPALAYGMLETLPLLMQAEEKRKKLAHLINYFRQCITNSSLLWRESYTPIQQLKLGCPFKAMCYADFLKTQRIFCQAIREPTVTKKETGLRVILNAHHEPEHIDYLFLQLQRL